MVNKKLNQKTLIIGLAAALVCVVLGVFVFAYAMETLDVKAEQLGASEQPIYSAPFADYTLGRFKQPLGCACSRRHGNLADFRCRLRRS